MIWISPLSCSSLLLEVATRFCCYVAMVSFAHVTTKRSEFNLLEAMASPQAVTHAQRVTRLYRQSLKNALSWCIDRATWREEALRLRGRFEANRHVLDRRLAVALVRQGEEELQKKLHPDPYLDPKAPDGTLWERNPLPPKEILQMTPDEQQWYKEYIEYHNSPSTKVPAWDDPAVSPYPKFVWAPTGGWYCNPPNWKRNTGLAFIFILASSGVMWYVSAQLERRPVPPYRLIPSQLWCKHAKVDDPRLQSPDEPETVTHNPPPLMAVENKWPRVYERVPELEEVDINDFVAYTKSRHQRVRDRAVHREEMKILHDRVSDCVKREEVNHLQRCRPHYMAYWKSLRKYHSEGWLANH